MEFNFQNMHLQCYKLEKLITSKICSKLLVFHELWIKIDNFFEFYLALGYTNLQTKYLSSGRKIKHESRKFLSRNARA